MKTDTERPQAAGNEASGVPGSTPPHCVTDAVCGGSGTHSLLQVSMGASLQDGAPHSFPSGPLKEPCSGPDPGPPAPPSPSGPAPHLLPVLVRVPAGPEEMGAGAHGSALVRLLQELGGGESALRPQRLVVLLPEALHPLERANDQRDGRQLGFGVTDLVLVQRERLADRAGALGGSPARGHFPSSSPTPQGGLPQASEESAASRGRRQRRR